MKKFISIVLLVVLSISLVGCNSPTDTKLEDRVIELENRLDLLEIELQGLVGVTGLNGQTDYYKNEYEPKVTMSTMTALNLAKTEKDYIDVTKVPEYIFDEFGDYIDIQELNNMLCMKYLDMSCNSTTGFQYKVQAYKPNDMTANEYMVRVSMMIEELSHYDFYIIDSPELYIEFIGGGSQYIKVRMSILIDDKYDLHPAVFWNGLLDTRIEGITFSNLLLDGIYDGYIETGEFSGYVLPGYK